MRRAIVTFIQNKFPLKLQVSALYMSLKTIRSKDTDLIVFGDSLALSQLHFKCIKVPYYYKESPPFKDYPFLYSLSCMNSPNAYILDDYDYLLRSDVDTFLTPHFNDFYPTTYTFSDGSYLNTPEVKEHLLEVSNKLGLRHQGIHNISSTHYGKTSEVKEVNLLATEITKYLLDVEFKSSPGKWPGWYRGVSSLYASELALNHLISEPCRLQGELDFPSTSTESISEHAHIHCYHTNDLFSKFVFEKGGYSNLSFSSMPTKINEYALYIAQLGKKALIYGVK